jgi:phosphate starvation-inducible protein PhoH
MPMKNIKFQNIELTRKRVGSHNTRLEKISSAFNVTLNSRDNTISLAGQDTNLAAGKNPFISNIIDAYEKNKN